MNSHSYNLNTYTKIPEDAQIDISNLIDFGTERINLYVLLEDATEVKELKPGSKEWDTFMKHEVKSRSLKTYDTLLQPENVEIVHARKKDNLAHWFLSLCYCKTKELQYNFIKWEVQWFILMYKQLTKIEKEFFLKDNFTFCELSTNEKHQLENELKQCESNYNESLLWCKAPFNTISTSLISGRKIFLHKGIAYFPKKYIISCVREDLIKQFAEKLEWNKRMLDEYDDQRLRYVIKATPIFVARSKNKLDPLKLEVDLQNIEDIAKDHYPPCMKNLHDILKKEHHLKYDSKMQYGIFLKWLGLSYEDAMVFWEEQFTKKMTKDRFKKEYLYLFKHQYGKVGGRIDYPPYSCSKIQSSTPIANQCHGCPFKHWDKQTLKRRLKDDHLLGVCDIEVIVQFVNQEKYNEACTAYFNTKHNVIKDDLIESPNQYAEESYNFEKDLNTLMNSICSGLDHD